jgi:transcriptional regulator with XRE-family HTH domain
MNEKLRILMQNEKLTASKLAEILEVKPAAISHILSGRNKPSFELLCKLVNRFPQINPYWLMGDAQEMYNSSSATAVPASSAEITPSSTSGTLFDQKPEQQSNSEKSNISDESQIAPISTLGRTDIDKIIIVYRDQTFEELRPKR